MSYYDDARARARRRKSPWNLLLIPAIVLPIALLWRLAFALGGYVHLALYPGQTWRSHSHGLGAILAAVAPFFATIPTALYMGNIIVCMIPAARRTFDREAIGYPGTDFRSSQQRLLVMIRYIVPPALLLTVVGVLMPWYV